MRAEFITFAAWFAMVAALPTQQDGEPIALNWCLNTSHCQGHQSDWVCYNWRCRPHMKRSLEEESLLPRTQCQKHEECSGVPGESYCRKDGFCDVAPWILK